jgi:hypothetical protein
LAVARATGLRAAGLRAVDFAAAFGAALAAERVEVDRVEAAFGAALAVARAAGLAAPRFAADRTTVLRVARPVEAARFAFVVAVFTVFVLAVVRRRCRAASNHAPGLLCYERAFGLRTTRTEGLQALRVSHVEQAGCRRIFGIP